MFDYYRLPYDFPGYNSCTDSDPYQRMGCLESEFSNDFNDRRFIPYIQMHEFEALLLSSPEELSSWYIEETEAIDQLKENISAFDNPEMIDRDNPPSKRILKKLPSYKKVVSGPIIAGYIGMERLMVSCRHFREWIQKLESC